MNIKLVIFDFDGTLANTLPWFMNVVNHVADKYKFRKIQKEDHEKLRRYDAKKVLTYLNISFWKLPMIANHIRALMQKSIHQISLYEGIDKVIQHLHNKGIQLALVSSNSYDNILHVLGPKNINLFNHFECGVSVFGKKSRLKKILNKTAVPYDKSIYIGDEIRDVEAANNLNMISGCVTWGYNRIEAFKPYSPKMVFHNIDEIVKKIV